MKPDNSYYEDEVREGYYIPGNIKRSWAVQIDVLLSVIDICNKHDIKWFAYNGTLIGAIRHNGFIPWDDDLDICMLKDDYDRFLDVADDELPDGYSVINIYKDTSYTNPLSRVINHDKVDTSLDFMEKNHGFPYSTGIDIFPLYYVFSDFQTEENRRNRAGNVWNAINDYQKGILDLNELINRVEMFSGYKLPEGIPVLNGAYRVMDRVFSEATSIGADYVALMPFWGKDGTHKYSISMFDHSVSVPFEYISVNVPGAYKTILKMDYGKWEIADRRGGIHCYPMYGKQEDLFEKENNGRLPYKFYYDENKEKTTIGDNDIILRQLDTLVAAHDVIEKNIIGDNYEQVLALLEKCQDMAIEAGRQIESIYGENENIIRCLEKYCEGLYIICECIFSGDYDQLIHKNRELKGEINGAVGLYLKEKDTDDVVIISRSAKEWMFVEEIYKERINAGKNVKVVKVPYFKKDSRWGITTEICSDDYPYPEGVNVIEHSGYSFEYMHPAEIVIQDPYDRYASAVSIHPFYYSHNLKLYTRCLTYVQSFEVDEIEEGDEKGQYISKGYVLTPGVKNSDLIYVQSDKMRRLFADIIYKASNESQDKIDKKLMVLPRKKQGEVKDSRFKTNSRICFYVGYASFYENRDAIIDKLHRTIETFNKYKDTIRITWYADSGLSEYIKDVDEDMMIAYKNIITTFGDSGIGEYIVGVNAKDIIEYCDAYYGDPGFLMNLALRRKIPVMEWDLNVQ